MKKLLTVALLSSLAFASFAAPQGAGGNFAPNTQPIVGNDCRSEPPCEKGYRHDKNNNCECVQIGSKRNTQ